VTRVYVLYDSSNGPSNVYLPILSETASIQGSYLIRTEQPYFLDTTAMAGWALMVAYHATGTQAYLTAAEDALSTIHWGMTPFPGFSVLPLGYVSIPDAYRLWVYANQTYIDTDFSTYKAMLVAYFAEQYAGGSPLNATLAETAMSRVWGRTSWTYTQASVYTGESTSPHENLVKFANVVNDGSRASGVRHGAGYILGMMKLKAIDNNW